MKNHLYPLFTIVFLSLSSFVFGQSYSLHSNIPYDTIPGVSPNLLSLDVYVPDGASSLLPVVIYVHGGSWKGGTKSQVGFKAELFTDSNYVFVSVNYRLSPDPPDTSLQDAVRFPDHPRDVAKAISVIYEHIHTYKGDASNMHLIGHSAGAHLINLVSTNASFLNAFGLSPSDIGCTCSLDAGVWDIALEIEQADPSRQLMLMNAFGLDTTLYPAGSPLFQIPESGTIPSFYMAHQNTPNRILKTGEFRDSLLAKGHMGTTFNAGPYDHGGINGMLGNPFDSIGHTQNIMAFFKQCSNGLISQSKPPLTKKSEIVAYPNPTSGAFYIEGPADYTYQIINMHGQGMATGRPDHWIDIGAFPAGLYKLVVMDEGLMVDILTIAKLDP